MMLTLASVVNGFSLLKRPLTSIEASLIRALNCAGLIATSNGTLSIGVITIYKVNTLMRVPRPLISEPVRTRIIFALV